MKPSVAITVVYVHKHIVQFHGIYLHGLQKETFICTAKTKTDKWFAKLRYFL